LRQFRGHSIPSTYNISNKKLLKHWNGSLWTVGRTSISPSSAKNTRRGGYGSNVKFKTKRFIPFSLDAINSLPADICGPLGTYLNVFLVTQQHWSQSQVGLVTTGGRSAWARRADPDRHREVISRPAPDTVRGARCGRLDYRSGDRIVRNDHFRPRRVNRP
jgi:hypothetical protein